jgi:ribosomal protein L5
VPAPPAILNVLNTFPAGGDRSGNIGFGLTADQMTFFPEIETSFDVSVDLLRMK